jgi:uncharacterized protein (TIGR03382 family)
LNKSFLTAAISALCFCSGAQAATYPGVYSLVSDSANNSVLYGVTPSMQWNSTTFTVNSTGDSYITGTSIGLNGVTYAVNITLQDTYQYSGPTTTFSSPNFQYWGTFFGTFTGNNGSVINIHDIAAGRDVNSDAVLGINATPYNNGQAGGNLQVMEFGLHGDDSPGAGGNRNIDVNLHVTCISSPANANGTCNTAAVPVPGTVGLLSLALLGLFRRPKKA